MSERTLEQKRAAHALDCVKELAKSLENAKPDSDAMKVASCYRSYVESLPAHIVMGGLGQALATEWAAARPGDKNESQNPGRKAHAQLANDLAAWLGEQKIYANIAKDDAGESLIGAVMKNDEKTYLRAQAEALAWLVWLKKFCQAMLPKVKVNDE